MVHYILPHLTCGLAVANALATLQPQSAFDWNDTNFLLAFGDSYTYVQGTLGYANSTFIGSALNFSYTPEQLFTSVIEGGQLGTAEGGPNWVMHLTDCFSGLPTKCPKKLWDFAFGGSDVSTEFTPLHHNWTVSFVNQTIQWDLFARPFIPVDLSKALVAIWIGINDIGDSSEYTFPRNNASNFPEFYTEIINTEFQAIEKIWDAGYKNYLIMNLPPLEQRPGATAASHPNLTQITEYNNIINSTAADFAAAHPGSNVMVFDAHSFLTGILDDPSKYGIKNTTSFCPNYDAPDIATNYAAYGCLPIYEYFWYNSGHLTYSVHKFLARAVEDFLIEHSKN